MLFRSHCRYCRDGQENLCDGARFTGYQIDGGYAEYTVAQHRFVFPLPGTMTPAAAAPLTARAAHAAEEGPMRVCLVTDAWAPQVNGVVRTLTETRHELRRMGHTVRMITPLLFPTLPCPTYPEIRLSLFPSARLHHMLKLFAPDAIHLVTEGPLGWAARAFCLKRDIPFTSAYHTRLPEYVHARIRVPIAWSYALVRRFHAPSEIGRAHV